ncbi:hypothetical protein FNH13_02970 [Ornithinimicrobium ciconiae]|uniref:Antitoxin n=1 Tax=Ornithinimicrobium ciconiae TaxID=2594265 RepID=A0A516G7C3_9MICO|nr:hypothetical protein FNH13_02970 [Ornithinimicrobium ciconiae]
MRTTVDLPPSVHQRARRLAAEQGRSLSAVVAELTTRGLAQLDAPAVLTLDELTGLPVLSIGRPISTDEVAEILDDE